VGRVGLEWKKSLISDGFQMVRRSCITNPLVVHGLSIGSKTLDEDFYRGFGWLNGYLRLVQFVIEFSLLHVEQSRDHGFQRVDQFQERSVGCVSVRETSQRAWAEPIASVYANLLGQKL